MSLERGTRPGAPHTDRPTDSGWRIAVAAVVVAVSLACGFALANGALTPGAGSGQLPSPTHEPTGSPGPAMTPEPSMIPEPSMTLEPVTSPEPSLTPPPTVAPTPTATPTPRPTPTVEPGAAAGDPTDLPRYPGSRLVEQARGRSGDLATLQLEYTTPARVDLVRGHYRTMLRRYGWFVGDVEFDDDGWEIEANKGAREASIEIQREGGTTEVEIEISWPAE